MPGPAQAPVLLVLAACLSELCAPGLATSKGHPLPVPLKEGPLFPRPAGSHAPARHGERPLPPTAEPAFGDYSDEYDYDQPPAKPQTPRPSGPLCGYDFCQHLQVPCSELRRASGCLCPGVTGPGVAPEPPSLRAIHMTETGASAHWCAPLSTVESYQLRYRPAGGDFVSGPALNSTFRLTAVAGLSPGQEYLFCIVASNRAGSSPTDDGGQEHGPCRVGRTPSRQMPYAYIAAGLAAALVLLVVSALAWHFSCRRKKRFPRGSLDHILESEPGLGGAANSSFRNEEQL